MHTRHCTQVGLLLLDVSPTWEAVHPQPTSGGDVRARPASSRPVREHQRCCGARVDARALVLELVRGESDVGSRCCVRGLNRTCVHPPTLLLTLSPTIPPTHPPTHSPTHRGLNRTCIPPPPPPTHPPTYRGLNRTCIHPPTHASIACIHTLSPIHLHTRTHTALVGWLIIRLWHPTSAQLSVLHAALSYSVSGWLAERCG
jgi:hypothetical protein